MRAVHFSFIVCIAAILHLSGNAAADEIVLSMTGNSERTKSGALTMTLTEFEAIGLSRFSTTTPWHDDEVEFEGVSGMDFVTFMEINGTEIEVVAINDYKAIIPVSDLIDNGLLFATRKDGKLMSVREKGPIFAIYPFSSNTKLQNEVFFNRSVWQIKALNFK